MKVKDLLEILSTIDINTEIHIGYGHSDQKISTCPLEYIILDNRFDTEGAVVMLSEEDGEFFFDEYHDRQGIAHYDYYELNSDEVIFTDCLWDKDWESFELIRYNYNGTCLNPECLS